METVHELPGPTPADGAADPRDGDSKTAIASTTLASRIGTFRSGATGLNGADLAVLASLFFLPCAFLPIFQMSWWTPRMMVLLAVIPAGLVAVWRLARAGDIAARWACACVVICFVSALTANSFLASFKGYIGQDASVLAFLGAFALWALARFMSADGNRLVVPVLLSALGANLFIATLQVVARIENGPLALQAGRATGFTPNPVYLGALMAGATALCLHRLATVGDRRRVWAFGVFAFSIGVAFSGSRVALGAVVLVALFCFIRGDRVWAALGVLIAVAGSVVGSFVARTVVSGRDSVSRLAESPSSAGRLPVWRVAFDAATERPVFGWGIGQFRFATQGRLSVEDVAPLNGSTFFDAHNIVVGLVVAVGIPGLICFLGFVWSTARRLSPEVGVVIAAIATTWMLQPLSLTTLPVVFALLGVWSVTSGSEATNPPPLGGRIQKGAVAVGLVGALALGGIDFAFNAAVEAENTETLLALEPLYMNDPIVANIVAQTLSFGADDDVARRDEMFDAFQRSIEFEPTRARWWYELSRQQGHFGDPEAALESAQQALSLEPFERRSWFIVRVAADELGDDVLEREALDVMCQLQVDGACEAIENPDVLAN